MRFTLMAAAIGGFLAVAMGAFATHGLQNILDMKALVWIETGVRYQAWHSLALLAVAVLMAVRPARPLSIAAGAFSLGMLMFSGSLYAMAFSDLRSFAMITPIGGGFFLVGWVCLGIYAWRLRRSD